jgi:hypothetical protein
MSDHDGQDHRPMAGGDAASLGSEAMEVTPALDATLPRHDPDPGTPHQPESLVEALEYEPAEAPPLSLASRLRQPRTILSIVVPLAIIGFFLYLNRERLAEVPSLILQANPALVLAAFVVFYLGFPLRGYRWSLLLRESGFELRTRQSSRSSTSRGS